jgi:hypothetical protein
MATWRHKNEALHAGWVLTGLDQGPVQHGHAQGHRDNGGRPGGGLWRRQCCSTWATGRRRARCRPPHRALRPTTPRSSPPTPGPCPPTDQMATSTWVAHSTCLINEYEPAAQTPAQRRWMDYGTRQGARVARRPASPRASVNDTLEEQVSWEDQRRGIAARRRRWPTWMTHRSAAACSGLRCLTLGR